MAKQKILLLNGPNLNMLGTREPEVYGHDTLESLEATVRAYAKERRVELTCFQSNSESRLIGKVHKALEEYDGIVFNPGAYTHYSYALRDAVGSIDVPVVEVHLSDIESREAFRRTSVIAPACVAQVKGLGVEGYCRAIDVLLDSEDLTRLGEGYEKRCDMTAPVILSSSDSGDSTSEQSELDTDNSATEQVGLDAPLAAEPEPENEPEPEPEIDDVAENASEPKPEFDDVVEGAPEPDDTQAMNSESTADFTAPFADAIAEADMGALSRERQGIMRAACAQLGIDALLVRDTPSIHWITGFDNVFDEERAHALLIANDFTALHTDSRYSNAIHDVAVSIGSNIFIDESRVNHFQFAHQSLAPGVDGAFIGMLGIEDSITYAEFTKATGVFGTASIMPTHDVVTLMRSVKDEAEIVRLRAAQAVTDAAFRYIVDFIRPGMTEREVKWELEGFMLRHGADGLAFSSIVACGENGADPHAIPGDKRLEAGQCVVMDFGAKASGYCADMTRVVFLGEPSARMARAWEVLREANETVERMLRPGVIAREAHEAAERVLADGGFAGRMGHGLGHGVGLECHELPVLNARNDDPLLEGNVVTVEPGIYLPGEFGMRLEDCGVVTSSGYDVFSQLGHEMTII